MAQRETGAPTATDDDADELASERRGGFGSLGSIIYLLVLTWAAGIASFPLNDNSFFTHLATGRIILDEGRVPSSDPYTFTAQGEPWTVQSWLASVAYAGAERLGGDVGLRVLVLAVFLVAMTTLWKLTDAARSVAVRLVLLLGALFIVTDLWTARPYMVGVIGTGVVWLALEGRVRPWLLIPLMWVWANTHGSFPLALALVVLVIVGASLDRRATARPARPTTLERQVAGSVLAGTLLGGVSPVGPKLLAFPLTAIAKSGAFSEIVEWSPPTYDSLAERTFLLLVLATVLLLVRRGSWRLALPGIAFAAGGLYAQRNVVMATVVLVAVSARSTPSIGTLTAGDRPSIGRPTAIAAGAVFALVAGAAMVTPVLSAQALGGYPGRPIAWVSNHGHDGRLAAQPFVGNLFEVLDGATGEVFVDDRADMFPSAIFEDSLRLDRGAIGWQRVLDRYDISVVIWRRDAPTGSLLAASPDWAVVYSDAHWVVTCRRAGGCAPRPP